MIRITKKNQIRFFSKQELAEAAMKSIAIENQCTVYLYRLPYGRGNMNAEYSIRLHNEVLDAWHENVIDQFTPQNLLR